MPASLALAVCLLTADPAVAARPALQLSFDVAPADDAAVGLDVEGVTVAEFTAGDVINATQNAKRPTINRGAARFDGEKSLVRITPTDASTAAFTDGDFTWEGFFFWPVSNQVDFDKAISDRFITQFKDDKSGSTRLTLGLSRVKAGEPAYLSIATAGESGRHVGKRAVVPDVWHHFALVVTAAHAADDPAYSKPAKAVWYLDYEKCGEVTFDEKSPATTLAPLGASPMAVGGRNFTAGKVDRGFAGLLDEIRISPRAVPVAEFLRAVETTYDRLVQVDFIYPLAEPLDWQQLATARATETLTQEAVGIAGTPQPFSLGGFAEERRGTWGIRATRELALPAGRYQLLVRAATDCVLEIDGRTVVDARPLPSNPLSPLPAGLRDFAAQFDADGGKHVFRLLGAARFESTAKAPKEADAQPGEESPAAAAPPVPNEVIVGYAPIDAASGKLGTWRILGGDDLKLDAFAWNASRGRTQNYWATLDAERRAAAVARRDEFWQRRHEWAAELAAKWDVPKPAAQAASPIDAYLADKIKSLNVQPAAVIDDAAYLRRVTLDLAGRNPTRAEAEKFFADTSADKREKLVDRLLASNEWADAWVGYWQDLLAENPSILKPTLNNSGPFRRWIYESFAANKPLDQFATELILMQGTDEQGGTAGFAMSSGNDLPMAMKGHVLAQAFLAIDMKCARCHDAPYAPIEQGDLFALAAMLDEKPITVPKASTVVVPPGARQPAVTSNLKAGDKVLPEWPLDDLIPTGAAADGVSPAELVDRPRARLAAIVTSPARSRFSDVVVNRVWQRFFAIGLVEPVDSWLERKESSHPELLAYLSREFVRDGYDMKKLVRRIVTSDAYARAVGEAPPIDASQRTFAAQTRRRLSAEQVVDSLFAAVGKTMQAEELNFDPNGTQGFLTLPAPERSWQFASLSNERDRPALALPTNQMILDVLTTFGWRETRPDPWTRTDAEPNPLQPLMLANGTIVNHVVRLTEDNIVTEWCVEDLTVDELVDRLFETTLGRKPNGAERDLVTGVLAEGFAERRTGKPKPPPVVRIRAHVDWDKHLKGEASVELLEAEKQARQGDPPTVRLTAEYRRRVEDVLWSLVNSPEFVFVP